MLIQGLKSILIWNHLSVIFVFFLFCMCEMGLIWAERYKNEEVDFLRVRKTDEIWVSMKNVHGGLGVKSMFDLIWKKYMANMKEKAFQMKRLENIKWLKEKVLKCMII